MTKITGLKFENTKLKVRNIELRKRVIKLQLQNKVNKNLLFIS